MQLFGRPVSSALRALARLPSVVTQVGRVICLFRKPYKYIMAYAVHAKVRYSDVEFRDGMRITLSENSTDLITVFVVFAKRDYGSIPVGGTVLDVGANIGCFTLYCARAGARRIIAVEPSSEAYATLVQNVEQNGLTRVAEPLRLAVTAQGGMTVPFPVRSSPENRVGLIDAKGGMSNVKTTTVQDLLGSCNIGRLDLLKLDCEGAEYDIIFGAPPTLWDSVNEIRLEYHDGRANDLRLVLEAHGYTVTRHRTRRIGNSEHGDLWFSRIRSAL